jgi:predicted aspartyl protease
VNTPFNAAQGLIIVAAPLWGPAGDRIVRLALDTGATATVVRTAILVSIGYDPAVAPDRVQMTTGSGIEYTPRLTVSQFEALEQQRAAFPVVAHTLPPSASIDGLLGLDFLRGQRLTIDFRRGQISLR